MLLRVSVFSLAVCAGLAQAQFVPDGDFDGLPVGDAPDCGAYAGNWGFPPHYATNLVCELSTDQISIVSTSLFDPTRTGNSMRLNATTLNTESIHVASLFRTIYEVPGQVVRFTFEVFVPTPGVIGGSVYIGGDHSGNGTGGFVNTRDRGPQLTWNALGEIVARLPAGLTVMVPSFPYGQWQTVAFDINLSADTFDLYWAPTGSPLQLIGSNLGYRSTTQAFLDRFTLVHFGDFGVTQEMYLDNISSDYCYADCDQSTGRGVLDIFDFLCFQNEFAVSNPYACEADTSTGPATCDIFDFLGFQNSFAAGCP